MAPCTLRGFERFRGEITDEKMSADFGMARMCALDQTEGNTNRVAGTYRYMAPEYAMFGQFSIKSDVFSFGVLILKIAWRNWKEWTALNLIDPVLTDGRISEMIRSIHIGLLCIQENVDERPNMASVVSMLNSNSVHLPVLAQPASFMPSTSLQLDMKCRVTQCEVIITELSPR
ncbi:Cysteine-rich receptor-like protein kinase 8 [Morella rubra]|uniref:Cysteine-rich receptor-like protein kinase 8 n=1 Tax=Morella rubra TaxID=262757 RepID=A0A6A1UT03_9ROSI|nr:Cysteine-rich receptor-like protein kinase 8 [Morella rubra]